MAQQTALLDQEHFNCSICLDLLKDPVTIPCDHNYCRGCIEKYWEDRTEIFSCPQCCHTFSPRPDLKSNDVLGELVESLKRTGLQVGDVPCDFCTGKKDKAVKTCLQCLVSYCDTHLQSHYQSPAFKNHKLVTASTELQENLCIQQKIQEREQDMKLLHQEVESINQCADRAVKDSDAIFTELNSSIERRHSGVTDLIRDQQKREVNRAEEQRKEVEQEVTELKKRLAELEKLSYIQDHVNFLHSYSSLSRVSDSTHNVKGYVHPPKYFENVTVSVSKMREKLEVILKEEGTNISETVNRVDVLLSSTPEPKTRAEFLKYLSHITLDANTLHQHLALSKENRKISWMNRQQTYPHHPERFVTCHQVLSREGLTGRCYWEVEWAGYSVDIAVSYREINRKGNNDSRFGQNDKSWSLRCCKGYYVFIHRNSNTVIPGCVSSRIGVYLDQSAGTLSFYSVLDPMTLLHSVQTTFPHTVYAGFWLGFESTVEFLAVK